MGTAEVAAATAEDICCHCAVEDSKSDIIGSGTVFAEPEDSAPTRVFIEDELPCPRVDPIAVEDMPLWVAEDDTIVEDKLGLA